LTAQERFTIAALQPDEPDERDGRRLRSQDSRKRIVQAMLELIHGGEVSPSAEQVAARAGVGLRTVFRHFKDMDSLYAEMSVVIEAELRSVLDQPFVAEDWRGRVVEVVARRSTAFERIGPFKRASLVHRHRSAFLEANHVRLVESMREILRMLVPPEVVRDPLRFEALDLLLSFESWSRLRRDQGLSLGRARAVLESVVRKLIE
jgi:AcrR family transcriptional regulator